MATTKKQAFDIPFIGYDYGKDFNWDFDVLFGQYGNPIIGIKIKNIVEQYSADPDNYLHFHTILNQVVSIIGEGRIVQKLDIFSKKKYSAEKSNQFLQQKYSEHFDGRLFRTIETVLFFTDFVDDKLKKKTKPYQFNEKSYKELRDKCQKVWMLLKQNNCEPQFLFEKDFEYFISFTKILSIPKIFLILKKCISIFGSVKIRYAENLTQKQHKYGKSRTDF